MINILTAFREEARPFIVELGLESGEATSNFPIYRAADVTLVITGQGRVKASHATSWLMEQAIGNGANQWLNFGIAGSARFSPGTVVQGSSVTYYNSGENWLCRQPSRLDLPATTIHTVDHPESEYPLAGVYDMEAAGIAEVLSESGELEKFVCIKLVTDGPDHPVGELNLQRIRSLVEPMRLHVRDWLNANLDNRR